MGIECQMTRRRLSELRGDPGALGRLAPHYAACLRCRAEAVRYRRLARALAALATHEEVPPMGLAAAVARRTAGPHIAVEQFPHATAPTARAAAVVGAIAAAAGTAVVVHVMRGRSVA
jgi:hypothetical protein